MSVLVRRFWQNTNTWRILLRSIPEIVCLKICAYKVYIPPTRYRELSKFINYIYFWTIGFTFFNRNNPDLIPTSIILQVLKYICNKIKIARDRSIQPPYNLQLIFSCEAFNRYYSAWRRFSYDGIRPLQSCGDIILNLYCNTCSPAYILNYSYLNHLKIATHRKGISACADEYQAQVKHFSCLYQVHL